MDERELVAKPTLEKDVEAMTPEEIVEVNKLYKLSAPIKIPLEHLDPNYEYRWVNVTPKNKARRQGIGWKPIDKQTLERLSKIPIKDLHMGSHWSPNNQLCIGDDLVFMYIQKRIPEAIRAAQAEENQARLGAGRRKFHDSGKLSGVETYDK
jgi:hypothetical protein